MLRLKINDEIKSFETISEAAKTLGVDYSTLKRAKAAGRNKVRRQKDKQDIFFVSQEEAEKENEPCPKGYKKLNQAVPLWENHFSYFQIIVELKDGKQFSSLEEIKTAFNCRDEKILFHMLQRRLESVSKSMEGA